jgi:hypothetical protein
VHQVDRVTFEWLCLARSQYKPTPEAPAQIGASSRPLQLCRCSCVPGAGAGARGCVRECGSKARGLSGAARAERVGAAAAVSVHLLFACAAHDRPPSTPAYLLSCLCQLLPYFSTRHAPDPPPHAISAHHGDEWVATDPAVAINFPLCLGAVLRGIGRLEPRQHRCNGTGKAYDCGFTRSR